MDTNNTGPRDYSEQLSNMSATYGKLSFSLTPILERYLKFLRDNKKFALDYVPAVLDLSENGHTLSPLQIFAGYVTFSPKQNYDEVTLVPNAYIEDPQAWEEWVTAEYMKDYNTILKAIGGESQYYIARITTDCFENASHVLTVTLGLQSSAHQMSIVYIDKKTGMLLNKNDLGRFIHSSYDSMCFVNK